MITVNEAEKLIHLHVKSLSSRLEVQQVPLEEANGKILKEDIFADRNQPPFDRVAMDGIAIVYNQYVNGKKKFIIEDVQAAGAAQKTLKSEENCLEVMTGAVLPKGLDTVIRYEDLRCEDGMAYLNDDLVIKEKQNIHFEGLDHKSGDLLLKSGTPITSSCVAVLASCGKSLLKVAKAPKIAIISTGSELVEINEIPLSHQIRKSNAYTLSSELELSGLGSSRLFHFTDDENRTFEGLKSILAEYDVIVLSGGVSMGKFDFVPKALSDLKVEKLFHKIKQKPGKPMWFGKGPEGQLVFALPGNPVSCLFCLRRYVIPSLTAIMGQNSSSKIPVILTEDRNLKKPLTLFLPASLRYENGAVSAKIIKTNGSGDYYSLSQSEGFIELCAEKGNFEKGCIVPFYPWGNK